jgi:hypothetical protein
MTQEEQITKDHNASPETLDEFSNDSRWWIRLNVANNPNTSIYTLGNMFQNVFEDANIRDAISNNLNKRNSSSLQAVFNNHLTTT